MSATWPWVLLAAIGAYHGLNPGMGWLFALALGIQEKSQKAVLWALAPIAVGHAVAIAAAILVLRFAETILAARTIKLGVALILFAMGSYRIFRARHPRGGGMRVGFRDLTVWSFLMATSHGAGIMLMPILLAQPANSLSHGMHRGMQPGTTPLSPAVMLLAVMLHTAALLVVAGALANVFYLTYEKFGLNFLRHAWVNFDLVWAIALFVAGALALFV
jgi:hypothetical protein